MTGLVDLDDLLSESVALAREASAVKTMRDRQAKGQGSAAERAEDAARITAWQDRNDWIPQANVALFHNFHCACGESTSVFQGLFLRQLHRHMRDGSQRWKRVEAADAELPNEVAVRDHSVPMCTACAEGKGWLTDNGYDLGDA